MGPAWGPCLALALNAVCLGLWQGSTVPWLPGNGVHLLLGLALANLAAILLGFRAFWKQPVWRGKVVWVVGASQGLGRELRCVCEHTPAPACTVRALRLPAHEQRCLHGQQRLHAFPLTTTLAPRHALTACISQRRERTSS